MKHEDIDDFLVNIEGDGALAKPTEEKEAPENTTLKPGEILSQERRPDISFLDDIDSTKPSDGDQEYKEILKKELSEESAESEPATEEEHKEKGLSRETAGARDAKAVKEFKTVEFVLKGTRTWNTREPYIAPLDIGKIQSDYQDMEKTFYFIKDGANDAGAQGEMKRAMIKFISASGANVKEEYSAYIKNRLSSLVSDMGKEYDFRTDNLYLFIYHLGVLTLYRILINIFQDTKSGTCFKLITENSVAKYLPSEFIKEAVLKWHNDSFRAALPYDGIIEYNEIKRSVSRKYMTEYEICSARLDELSDPNLKAGGRTDRDQLLKTKWNEWFGKTNIFVYNRFLDRTIFKTAG